MIVAANFKNLLPNTGMHHPQDGVWGIAEVQKPQKRMTAALLLTSLMLHGCAVGPYRLQYLWQDEPEPALSYYVDKSSAIEYPIESEPEPHNSELFVPPRNIESLDEVEDRLISLAECKRLALEAEVNPSGRVASGTEAAGDNVLSFRPEARVSTIYDFAIVSTEVLFGGRGPEAALADFDARASSSVTWGRDEVPQNVANSGVLAGRSLVQETMSWQSRLEKDLVTGGQVSLQSNVNYDGNNRTAGSQRFQSSYSGLIQAEVRQPLLQGAGVEFTRVAGVQSQSLRGVSGVAQGVLIRRIENDKLLAEFEGSITTLVSQVEHRYWDLDLALRLYKSEKEAFEQLRDYWWKLKQRGESGVPILQAESRLFEADARIRGSLADVLEKEAQLRNLCNLPLNDGTFLYPSDAPLEAQFTPAWDVALQEAFSHRAEIRRQKWQIKSLELQLGAARSLTRPRLDLVSQYRRNGLGDHFLGGGNTLGNDIGNGQTEGWNFGFQWSMPIGLRLARIQERNYEFKVKKAKAILRRQEEVLAMRISDAMLKMQRWYLLADSTTRRIETAKQYVIAVDQLAQGRDVATSEVFNLYLQAQTGQRDAEQAYMRSIIEYNKAMTDLKYEKGTLLRDSNIYLAEGNWHPAAHPFALQRAEARTHAKDAHKLRTAPMEFAGQPAPSAFESLGTNSRPSIPGAMDEFSYESSELQPVPGDQLIQPPPVPPSDMTPMLVPPPDMNPVPEEPTPVPPNVPVDRDSITRASRSLRLNTNALAPVVFDDDGKSNTAGRVELP